ncbi:MAG TPA: adenine phosphoribosyltransferase [bacterium]|nr:adenine phosphoribosyltransferase [bacterium]
MEKLIKKAIKDVPDFPKPGIIFKDLMPVFGDGKMLRKMTDFLAKRYKTKKIGAVVCCEARGFLVGAPLAYRLGVPLVPVRKQGKLPRAVYRVSYDLEYGSNTLELHRDALKKGQKVLIIDDLLATGGTVEAAARLVEKCGAKVGELAFIVELDFLKGRDRLKKYKVYSIARY